MFTKDKKELINKQPNGFRHKKNGFTLMELIIVMAILAILVTLALLYYGNVTDSGYRDALLADLKQTDTAIALYEKEYNNLPMVETIPIDLDDQIISANNNVPAILNENNGAVKVYTVNRANMNLLKYIKKTTFFFKGNDDGDVRGAGMLYYVDTADAIDIGTSTDGTSNTIVLSGPAYTDDYYKHCFISIIDHNCIGQTREIIAYKSGTHTATVSPDWIGTDVPDNSDYEIRPPVKKGDLVFVQSAETDRLVIKDENGNAIYKY